MRKLLLLLSLSLLLVSCNIKERIVFNDDMSGDYEVSMDMSPILSISKNMGGGTNSDSKKKKEKIDTTIVFDDFLELYKDSIKTDEDRMKAEMLRGMTMHMKMDEDEGLGILTLSKKFTKFNELNNMSGSIEDALSNAKESSGAVNPLGEGSIMNKNTHYSYDGKIFKRFSNKKKESKAEVEVVEETEFEGKVESDDPDTQKLIQSIEMLEESLSYELEYVFPKRIKSVSVPSAIISKDRKTVNVKFDVKNSLENKDLMSFEVVFE
ncbi:hypothetical protein [Aureivirga sp. CE67]|uniref:hypothetical protein n=1 Tax=Aureivirga sp. CE67 TaxID=1788983 RepID=UPI0018C93110|nr:hypothetical protein [Aureivirga sp. CE67]